MLPLVSLIPIIVGALGAAGGVAGGAAGIAKAVHDKDASEKELEEQKRHNLAMEKKSGEGIEEFIRKTGLEGEARKVAKKFLENLSEMVEMTPKEGGALHLNPYRK